MNQDTYRSMEPLRPLHKMITDEHLNDYQELERKMCDIIYMLHYLQTETFAGPPARQVVHTLERFRECFQEAQEGSCTRRDHGA